MRERLVTLERLYQREYDYIIRNLERKNILYAKDEVGRRLAVDIATRIDQELDLESILVEVIITSFKWKYYESVLSKKTKVEDIAVLFCLLNFDLGAERKFFKEKVFQEREIHLDAIYNFSMGKIKSCWDGYAKLITEFYESLPSRLDKVELIAYMLSIINKQKSRIKYYIFDDDKGKIIQDIFHFNEKIDLKGNKYQDILQVTEEIFGKY